VKRLDVRMCQSGGDPDFTQKPFCADGRCEFGAQHLDGHLAMVSQVLGEIDSCPATGAEFALVGVAIRQSMHETCEGVSHVYRLPPRQ
jgi:hypothetical protein